MYELIETSKFRKDIKRIFKRSGADFALVSEVLHLLEIKGVKGIPPTMKPHKLKGKYKDDWECHLKPDLLIIWFQIESPKTIKLIRIGSHSDLF
ncbi:MULTISPECIES: type II toxin-antitoxin system RelE/ParE family toxin [Aequorivita]|jgi:mRNA interferase YafQ|uniref:Type II toxin-antitoxin system YafQ family toxin n=2 Tax=Aequorivita TaxID=153265 RepID=A0AB35YQ49_9FLAO|nr:type II toxin-antitoxin system YafQ family toxin [Aequorivita sp. Ant34-E75]MCZ4318222.1 type II toxin-antitoxin system YafQ family toxin [Aequorivita viscosa]WGF93450.1 type II toxin-antitoxin system YafQ family toxin [Aequorivita sp. Ant34-E75]